MIPKRRLRKRLTSDHRWGFTIILNNMEQLMIIHDTGSSKVKTANANAGLEYSFCVMFMLTQNQPKGKIGSLHIFNSTSYGINQSSIWGLATTNWVVGMEKQVKHQR